VVDAEKDAPTTDPKSYLALTAANANRNQPVAHHWQETHTAMSTQLELAPDKTYPELSGGGSDRGALSDQSEARPQVAATPPELQDPVYARVSRLLLLALDDVDSVLADAPYLPDPDQGGWRASLYPWIEDLARAHEHVMAALSCMGVQPVGGTGR
jgi:hypothetical protein